MTGGELQIFAAFLIDLVIGDPRNTPHPVKGIAHFAGRVETFLRNRMPSSEKIAGICAVVLVVGGTVAVSYTLLQVSFYVHAWLGIVVSIVILYFSFAARDLASHGRAVLSALEKGELELAREKVGMIVGRDVSRLTESEVAQATVESVAENTVDGVTAPFFYALLFGPVGALGYKAVNTLDSLFGYKNERYLKFGWASAKLDDFANYLPSRLTVPFVFLAAVFMRLDARAVFRSAFHTARLHESPNAGYSEAAFAGALGVRLGGPRSYGGVRQMLPYLGVTDKGCKVRTVALAVRLMILSAFLFLTFGLVVRLIVLGNLMWI